MSFTSYRIHSVFVLRLFNDPVAMVFLYAAVVAALKDRWWLTCALYRYGGKGLGCRFRFILADMGPISTDLHARACTLLWCALYGMGEVVSGVWFRSIMGRATCAQPVQTCTSQPELCSCAL